MTAPQGALTDALQDLAMGNPILAGLDFADMAASILKALNRQGLIIAPATLTDAMFAAGLAVDQPSLPARVMGSYAAELRAWADECEASSPS